MLTTARVLAGKAVLISKQRGLTASTVHGRLRQFGGNDTHDGPDSTSNRAESPGGAGPNAVHTSNLLAPGEGNAAVS